MIASVKKSRLIFFVGKKFILSDEGKVSLFMMYFHVLS